MPNFEHHPARLRRQSDGFSYVGLLITVAIIGIVTVTSVQTGLLMQRRSAEDELLFVGNQFVDALVSYANATPAGQARYPASLDDLTLDPRYPMPRRHLRKVYVDPITGEAKWGLVQTPDGGIIGVYSLSPLQPLKIANFRARNAAFEGQQSYRDWRFMLPEALRPPGAP